MSSWLDGNAWEEFLASDREFPPRGPGDECARNSPGRAPDDEWESLWTDLGGEG